MREWRGYNNEHDRAENEKDELNHVARKKREEERYTNSLLETFLAYSPVRSVQLTAAVVSGKMNCHCYSYNYLST